MSFSFFNKRFTQLHDDNVKKNVYLYAGSPPILPNKHLDRLIADILKVDKETLSYKILNCQDEVNSVLDLVIPKKVTLGLKPSVIFNTFVQGLSMLLDTFEDQEKNKQIYSENIKIYIHNNLQDIRLQLLPFIKQLSNKQEKEAALTLFNSISKARKKFYDAQTTPKNLVEHVTILRAECLEAFNIARPKLSSKSQTFLDGLVMLFHQMFMLLTGIVSNRIVHDRLNTRLNDIEEFATYTPR